jgi:hypothetical protein
MTTPDRKRGDGLRIAGLLLGIVVVITIVVVLLRVVGFSMSYHNGSYLDYPAFNMLPPLIITLVMRALLSPKKRSLPVTLLVFVVLLLTGMVQEYIIARHMALALGMSPADAPLLPTLTQYLVVMAGNIRAISFVLIGVVTGTLLSLIMGDLKLEQSALG